MHKLEVLDSQSGHHHSCGLVDYIRKAPVALWLGHPTQSCDSKVTY